VKSSKTVKCWTCGKEGCKSFLHNPDGSLKSKTTGKAKVNKVNVEQTSTADPIDHFVELLRDDDSPPFVAHRSCVHVLRCKENPMAVPLEYVKLSVKNDPHDTARNGVSPVKTEQAVALCDSGAEICLIRTYLLKELGITLNPQGSVEIRGIIGKPVEAQLAWIRLSLSSEHQTFQSCVLYQMHSMSHLLSLRLSYPNYWTPGTTKW